jgi:hypothetical protein
LGRWARVQRGTALLAVGFGLVGAGGSGCVAPDEPDVDDPDTEAPRPDPAAAWFEADEVRALELTLSEAAIAALAAEPREYVHGTLALPEEGIGPVPVGIRLKGQYGSYRWLDGKAAFKVDLNRVDREFRLHGLKELTLNNQVQDPSGVSEYAAYALFRAMGVPAPRVTWVTVRLNGEPYGPYLSVEGYDDVMLERWFDETDHLYEGAYGQDLVPEHVPWFEVDEGDEWDRADLGALAETIDETPLDRVVAATRDRIAWDEVARAMAVEVWTGHWDGYASNLNNYYLHVDGSGRVRLLPWGVDQTFSAWLGPFEGVGLLFQACLLDAECRDTYVRALLEVGDVAEALGLADDLVARVDALRPLYAADPRREWGPGDQDATLSGTVDFLDTRGAALRAAASCWLDDEPDPDEDGYACEQDCDPLDPDVHPGAVDTCGDGVDQDCSGWPDDAPDCPDCAERSLDGDTYWFCSTGRTYAEGEARCAELGAALVTLDDEAENEAVWAAAVAVRGIEWWIGAEDRAVEGVFVDPSGAPLAYAAWAEGEPNDWAEAEDCAHYWSSWPVWNDLDCESRLGTICEAPAR